MKTKHVIFISAIFCLFGFIAGRMTIKQNMEIEYIKGETIYRTIEVPKFITSTIPATIFLPVKKDTLFINQDKIVIQTVDTTKIIENYIAERRYAFNVFDNEYGKLNVKQTLQYNELQKFDYEFTPLQKVITRERDRMIVPFISSSYNTFGIAGAGGGMFYKNVGIEYKYLYNINNHGSGHEFGLKVKF